jgi:DNA-directed RNA polymerase subunit RPC12/RpoP
MDALAMCILSKSEKYISCYSPKITIMISPKQSKPSSDKPIIRKELMKYVCTNCKYRFQRSLEHGYVRTCPYCGRNTVQKEQKLASIIKEVSRLEEDF